jgi:hypothetical protein
MEAKESEETKSLSFQFVTIAGPGQGWKNENEHIVRSHVMRQLRRKQREEKKSKKDEKQDCPITESGERYGRPQPSWLVGYNSCSIYLQQLASIEYCHMKGMNKMGKWRKTAHSA